MKARESNIELLRIITICGVVMLHYNGFVAFDLVTPGTFNQHLLLLLEVLFIGAVDLFVLISGYFLCNTNGRKAIKALELVVQVMVIGMGKYLATVIVGNPFSITSLVYAAIPNNYYVTIYLALYLLSPYINIVLQKLTDKQFGFLVGLSFVLFALWPTVLDAVFWATGRSLSGLYPTNSSGSQYGYSFINFALMYLLGAYLRRRAPGRALWSGVGAVLCWGGLALIQLKYPGIARSYCNPLVILMAVFVFRLFGHLHFRSKPVNTLAKGAFTCFLLHDLFLSHIGIGAVVNRNPVLLLGHILVTIPAIFLISWVAWLVYDRVSKPVFRRLEQPLSKLDSLLSPALEPAEIKE